MRVYRWFEPLSIRQSPQSRIPLHGARQPEVTGPDVGVYNACGKDLAFMGRRGSCGPTWAFGRREESNVLYATSGKS